MDVSSFAVGPFLWPIHSPDSSSLDNWLWNELEGADYISKPNNIQEQQVVVEQATNNLSTADARNAVAKV